MNRNRNRSCGGVVLLFYKEREKEALERDAGEKERGRARLLIDPFLP